MYVTGWNEIYALDATTGRQLWTHSEGERHEGIVSEAGLGTNNILAYGTQFNLPNGNALIPVTEQCTAGCPANGGVAGLSYRNNSSYLADSAVLSWRAW